MNNIILFIYQFNFYLTISLISFLAGVKIWVSFMPNKNELPQNNGILKLFNGINNKNGPGHSPPIPQPSPNKKEPIIIFQSIEC